MANGCVPWPGPVPAPGASNVVMVGCGPTNGVLVKFRTPALEALEAVDARIPSTKIDVMAPASRRADAKTTLWLRNIFRRIFVFIRCLSFRDYLSFVIITEMRYTHEWFASITSFGRLVMTTLRRQLRGIPNLISIDRRAS